LQVKLQYTETTWLLTDVFKVSHQGKSSEGRNYSNKEQHEKNGRHPLRYRSRLGFWRYSVQWDSRGSSEACARRSGEGAPAGGTEVQEERKKVEKKVQEKVQEGQQRIEGEVKKGKQQVKEKAQ
jgi:hypothetical protein